MLFFSMHIDIQCICMLLHTELTHGMYLMWHCTPNAWNVCLVFLRLILFTMLQDHPTLQWHGLLGTSKVQECSHVALGFLRLLGRPMGFLRITVIAFLGRPTGLLRLPFFMFIGRLKSDAFFAAIPDWSSSSRFGHASRHPILQSHGLLGTGKVQARSAGLHCWQL